MDRRDSNLKLLTKFSYKKGLKFMAYGSAVSPKSVNWQVRNLILNCFVQEKQIENEIKIKYINTQEELRLVCYPVILKL